ncbi:MAG: hypothetical protein AB7V48_07115 [Sedimentibacter sp.]
MNKSNFKKISLIIVGISLIAFIILFFNFYAYISYYNTRIEDIQNQYDTRLDDYENNKNLALKYLDIYTINNPQKYTEVKDSIFQHLSENLQKEFTDLEKNISNDSYEKKCIIQDIKGTVEDTGSQIFKVEFKLIDRYTNSDSIIFITISNNKIISATEL